MSILLITLNISHNNKIILLIRFCQHHEKLNFIAARVETAITQLDKTWPTLGHSEISIR